MIKAALCDDDLSVPNKLDKRIPMPSLPSNGIGVQSIRAIAARHGGDCQFLLEGD